MKPNLLSARPTAALAATAIAGLSVSSCEPAPTLGERERTQPGLVEFESCDALAAAMRRNLKEYAFAEVGKNDKIEREQLWDTLPPDIAYGGYYGPAEFQPSLYDHRVKPAESLDVVKVVGDLVYALDSAQLEILDISDPTDLRLVDTFPVEGAGLGLVDVEGGVLLVTSVDPWRIKGDHPLYASVLAGYVDDQATEGDSAPPDLSQFIKVAFIAIDENGANPREVRSAYVPGRMVGAHRRGQTLTMAVYRAPNVYELNTYPSAGGLVGFISDLTPWDGLRDQELLTANANNARVIDGFDVNAYFPTAYLLEGPVEDATLEELAVASSDCHNTFAPDDDMGRGFTTLLTFDATSLENASVFAILGAPGTLRGRDGNLVLAAPSQEDWWYFDDEARFDPATNLHRFTYDGGALAYAGSARLEGALDDDDWSIDLERVVATTTPGDGRLWWREVRLDPGATVYALNPDLSPVGAPIAVSLDGTLVHADRHDGACYLSTDDLADPFAKVDLADRSVHTVEIRGLITDTLALAVNPMVSLEARLAAIGPSDDGTDVDFSKMRLSYFTVGDTVGNPGLSLVDSVEWSYGAEDDGWQHPFSVDGVFPYALQRFGDVVTVPLARYRYEQPSGTLRYLSKLKLAEIGDGGIEQVGEIDHGAYYTSADDGRNLRNPAIFRVVAKDGYLIAISDRAATAHLPFAPTPVSEVELPGSLYTELYVPCYDEKCFVDAGPDTVAVPTR